jgi:hypothetical protein
MSLRDLKSDFEIDDDVLDTAAGGAFSDIKTNVLMIVNELNSTSSLTEWKELTREQKTSRLQTMASANRRIFSMISAFGVDRLVTMIDDTIG